MTGFYHRYRPGFVSSVVITDRRVALSFHEEPDTLLEGPCYGSGIGAGHRGTPQRTSQTPANPCSPCPNCCIYKYRYPPPTLRAQVDIQRRTHRAARLGLESTSIALQKSYVFILPPLKQPTHPPFTTCSPPSHPQSSPTPVHYSNTPSPPQPASRTSPPQTHPSRLLPSTPSSPAYPPA